MAKKEEKLLNINRKNPPEWFKEADFGIFIHWGPSSVPAFAPVDVEDYDRLMKTSPPEYMFKNIPYADWYLNSLRIEGSPVEKYHNKNYPGVDYTEFGFEFKKSAKQVDVKQWAKLFKDAGAKYVVPVSKHHDGFVMFDTDTPNPNVQGYNLDFDYIGDLAKECRALGMRFGVYYSALIDWTFTNTALTTPADLFLSNDNSKRYRDYCYNHWMEIIDRYEPDILWCDIGYPTEDRLEDLLDYYYKKVPHGMVNDRWGQWPNILRNPIGKYLVNKMAERKLKTEPDKLLDTKYYDYRTIEYTSKWEENELWFEMCRGMDKSFGYNKYSRPQDYITTEEIREIVAEIFPKKGRMLLNVGPMQDGVIPDYQLNILKELAE